MAERPPVIGGPTLYGFRWGPATVERATEINGHVYVLIRGARDQVVVRVTPSGKVRIGQVGRAKEVPNG